MPPISPRRTMVPVALLLLLFLFVWSCVPKPITDLRLIQTTRVPASALPLSDHLISLRAAMIERDEVIWKVTLRGDANWIREVRQHELNSYSNVVLCDERDYRVFSLGPYIGQVPVTYYGEGLDDLEPPSSIVEYDVYVPETGHYRSKADPNARMPSYDFSSDPLLLCLTIAGGAMHGAYNESNEVRLETGAVR